MVNADGADLHRITTERFGADSPAVDPVSGKIVFSRWWHTPGSIPGRASDQDPALPDAEPDDPLPLVPPPPPVPVYYPAPPPRPPAGPIPADEVPAPSTYAAEVVRGLDESDFTGVNNWFLSSISPDGTDLAMFSGTHLDRVATNAYYPAFSADGRVFGLFLNDAPIFGKPAQFGLREYVRGIGFPQGLGGPQQFGPPERSSFRYASVSVLPDGRLLVGGVAPGRELPGGLDVFVQGGGGDPVPLVSDPSTAELDAVPLAPRRRPPVIPDRNTTRMADQAPRTVEEARQEGGTFTFIVENIFANAAVDELIPNAPPVGKRLDIEFYMAPQRTGFPDADEPILIERVPIPQSGRVEIELPAGVPLFEVLRRPDDTIAVGRDGQVFHVAGQNYGRAGERARCVGCHAGHSTMAMPAEPARINVAPSAAVTASSVRTIRNTELRPELLVDRRTDFFRSEWAAAIDDPAPTVRFTWGAPVEASEVVIYGARTRRRGVVGDRTQVVEAVTLRGWFLGIPVLDRTVERSIGPSGTRIPLAGEPFLDRLEITVDAMSGEYEGSDGVALAEVEIIGVVPEDAVPSLSFLRGDADCSGEINLTDAVAILGRLFRAEGTCCEAASDVNDDLRVNLSDPVFLLNHLFRGGARPPRPFPACAQAPERGLSCDREVCRL